MHPAQKLAAKLVEENRQLSLRQPPVMEPLAPILPSARAVRPSLSLVRHLRHGHPFQLAPTPHPCALQALPWLCCSTGTMLCPDLVLGHVF